jgi:hypothetical protein
MTAPRGAPLRCREVTEFLYAYLADELRLPLRASFDAHLVGCLPCRLYLASYRRTVALARDSGCSQRYAAPLPIPEALVAAVLAACAEAQNGRPQRSIGASRLE